MLAQGKEVILAYFSFRIIPYKSLLSDAGSAIIYMYLYAHVRVFNLYAVG